jgi:hypothetical protein
MFRRLFGILKKTPQKSMPLLVENFGVLLYANFSASVLNHVPRLEKPRVVLRVGDAVVITNPLLKGPYRTIRIICATNVKQVKCSFNSVDHDE